MEIVTNLAPFWHAPDGQEEETKAEFKLRPLTQPQLVELFATYENGAPCGRTYYRAGEIGILDMRGITVNGKPARWPFHKDVIPYPLVYACGLKLFVDAYSLDTESEDSPSKN